VFLDQAGGALGVAGGDRLGDRLVFVPDRFALAICCSTAPITRRRWRQCSCALCSISGLPAAA
jgi:hypothetical protein